MIVVHIINNIHMETYSYHKGIRNGLLQIAATPCGENCVTKSSNNKCVSDSDSQETKIPPLPPHTHCSTCLIIGFSYNWKVVILRVTSLVVVLSVVRFFFFV